MARIAVDDGYDYVTIVKQVVVPTNCGVLIDTRSSGYASRFSPFVRNVLRLQEADGESFK